LRLLVFPLYKLQLTLAIEPDFHRRDAIHSLINDLPDANYSCIRTLALHLHKYDLAILHSDCRVAENSDQNRMTVQNLASIFGPTILGAEGTALDAQIRVTETIVTYALDMFELGKFHLIACTKSKEDEE
jgi:Rho GTPase-activating protein RGD1